MVGDRRVSIMLRRVSTVITVDTMVMAARVSNGADDGKESDNCAYVKNGNRREYSKRRRSVVEKFILTREDTAAWRSTGSDYGMRLRRRRPGSTDGLRPSLSLDWRTSSPRRSASGC